MTFQLICTAYTGIWYENTAVQQHNSEAKLLAAITLSLHCGDDFRCGQVPDGFEGLHRLMTSWADPGRQL